MDKYYGLIRKGVAYYTVKVTHAENMSDERIIEALRDVFTACTRFNKDRKSYGIAVIPEELYNTNENTSLKSFVDKNDGNIKYHARVPFREYVSPIKSKIKKQLFLIGTALPFAVSIYGAVTSNITITFWSLIYISICTLITILMANVKLAEKDSKEEARHIREKYNSVVFLVPYCIIYNLVVVNALITGSWSWLFRFYSFMLGSGTYIIDSNK